MKTQTRNSPSIALLILMSALAGQALADPLQTVSVPDPGAPPPLGGGGDSYAPVMSSDGRYVLFASTANNLVVNSNNQPYPILLPARLNVFLRDRTNRTTTLVSVNLAGTGGGNDSSIPAALSTNGQLALFESTATDLAPNATNGLGNIFLRDLVSGTTTLVSVSTNHSGGNGVSRSSVMTPDGRYVAFVSDANNLVPRDTNGIADVFVRDLPSAITTLASVGAKGTNAGILLSRSESPKLTPDGRYLAFSSTATNLVAGVATSGNVYVRDLLAETTTWASSFARTALKSLNRPTNALCYGQAISDDGQFVAYQASPAPGQTSPSAGVVLRYNLGTGLTDLIHTNAAAAGSGTLDDLRTLDMTSDGRFIAFLANTNGTAGDTTCVYLWDAQDGTLRLASGNLSNSVPAGSACDTPLVDATGRFVAFTSSSTNMVTNALPGGFHLYVRDIQQATTLLADSAANPESSGAGWTFSPVLSADGRFLAFAGPDSATAPGARDHSYDVFVRDLQAAAPELISGQDPALPSTNPRGSSLISVLSLSSDGRWIAFASEADNLVGNDTNGFRDVFVRDLLSGTNCLISVATNGSAAGNGASSEPAISSDGRLVAFTSRAGNLAPGDTNNAQDVYLRDVQNLTTSLISVRNAGGGSGNDDSYTPVLSLDGRFVLFRSKARNLAAGSFSGSDNLFLRDQQPSATYALTTTGAGPAAMTPDGHYVAFGGATGNVYVWDSQAAAKAFTNTTASAISAIAISPDANQVVYSLAGQLYAINRSAGTNALIGSLTTSSHSGLRFSADSRFLALTAPLNGTNQVYLYDFQTGSNLLVSRNYSSSGPGYGVSESPDITADGRFIAYRSAAPDIVPADNNNAPDVFLFDRLSGITTLLSVNRFGLATGDNRSLAPAFSLDGHTVAFATWASDLAPDDFNQSADIFAYSIYSSGQIPIFSARIVPGPGRGASVIWPALPGKSYTVQYKSDLTDAIWQSVSGGVTIVGNQACFNDSTIAAGTRFYRVVGF